MDRKDEIVARWEQWLPPEPHRTAVVEFVARGRASIVQPDPNQPPLLLYEDGGSMVLPLVRHGGREPFYSAERFRRAPQHQVQRRVRLGGRVQAPRGRGAEGAARA